MNPKNDNLPLSPRTRELVARWFRPEDREAAEGLLLSLPAFPVPAEYQNERLCFAAIKLGDGSLETLRQAVELGRTDYRDLLMAADFGHDIQAHETWSADQR
jgi:hypothetical protein